MDNSGLPQGFNLDAPVGNPTDASGLPQGFQLDSEKYGGAGQQAIAGLEGIARGASFGASDLAETDPSINLGTPEAIKGRMQVNPITSGVGSMVGGAIPLALTGGLAAPAEALMGAGLGATALAGAGEGALFGAGNVISDYALGDKDLNAQKILADVGMGAAFGAGLGGLSKAVEAGAPRATQKLASALGNLKESVMGTEEAPSAFAQGLANVGGGLSGEAPADYASALNEGLKAPDGKLSIRSLAQNVQEIHGAAKAASKELFETILPNNVDEALSLMPLEDAQSTGADVLGKVKGLLSEESPLTATNKKIIGDQIGQLEGNIEGAKSAADIHGALDHFAKDFDQSIKFDTIPTGAQKLEQEALRDIRSTVRGNLKDTSLWGDAGMHYAEASDAYTALKNSEKNFQTAFMKREAAAGGGKRFVADPGKLKTFFNNFLDPSQDLRKGYMNDFLQQVNGLAEKSQNYHGAQEGESLITKHINSLAHKNQQLSEVAQAMSEGKRSNGLLGGTSGDILKAGMLHSLGIPNPIVGAALAAGEAHAAIINPYQFGRTLSNTFSKLKAIGDISNTVGKKIGSLSKGIFENNATRGAAISAVVPKASYDNRVKKLQSLNDPSAMINHLDNTTKHMYEAAPNISQGLHTAIMNGAQFLNSKVPQNPNPMPLSAKFEPSISQKESFERYYAAVDNPLSALKEVKSGTLSVETMEALQAVHPQLLQEMRKEVLSNINPKKMEDMPYAKKMSLGMFLGQPLDENMLPQMIQHNQMVLQANPSQGQQQAAQHKTRSTLGGLKELKIAPRAATMTQQLEEDSV